MSRTVGEMPIPAPAEPETELTVDPRARAARVLLVDDDERNLLALATVLEDLGEVVLARSGEEALRHLLKGEFAVIMLDVYMPGMDGYETAQIIRSRDQTKGIPIIFLFTGIHPDYHANTDHIDKIEWEKLTRIAQYAYEVGARVANLDHAPARDNKGPRVGKGSTGKIK